jgi:hypothetical protein
MPAPPQRVKLRKREVVFAVSMGALAAAGAAAVLAGIDNDAPSRSAVATADHAIYAVAPFEEISTVGPQDVVVTLGDTASVRAEGSPRALAQLEAVVENGRLTIRPKRRFGFSWGSLRSATFYVTVPRLEEITLAGSGDIRVDRIEGKRFDATVGGPGSIRIDSLKVDEAGFTVAGSGNLVAAGAARQSRVTVAGSGKIRGQGLHSESASVSIGGSGDVALTVEKDAQVSITGSGDVDITGPARCSVTRMGSGDVQCEGGGGDDDD